MNKQQEELLIALNFMYALANLIKIEHETYCEGVNALSPQIRVLAKRIKSDANTVIQHLNKVANQVKSDDYVIDYYCELHEAFKLLASCNQEDVQMFLAEVKGKVEA